MSGLLSLPTELLQEIGAEVADKTLRLVCKRINFALEPQILSEITLSSTHLLSQVESLVTTEPKPTSASKYATKLRIGDICPSLDQNGVLSLDEEAKIRLFLLPAIGSLVGVRQILWDLGESDPEWATLLVIDALASLPVLEDLHLTVWSPPGSPSVQFQRLSNLKKFTLISDFSNRTAVICTVAGLIGWNQPELTSLTIVNAGYYAPTLQDFLAETFSPVCLKITHLHLSGLFVKFDASALRHLRSLISLTILDISSCYDETTEDQGTELLAQNIWSTLRSENIHLQDLVTDDAQPALVDYLTSFSGLRRLRLTRTSSHRTAPQVSNQLAIHFYEQGLENHISFLESLEVSSSYEGMWCFGNHCSNVIKKGTRLTHLKLSINSGDIPKGEKEVRAYAKSRSPTTENAIWSLLDICTTLPILKSLRIQSASSENSRGSKCGNNKHSVRVSGWIAQNLESYGPITRNHLFHVSALWTEYAVRRDDLGADLGYRPIAQIEEED